MLKTNAVLEDKNIEFLLGVLQKDNLFSRSFSGLVEALRSHQGLYCNSDANSWRTVYFDLRNKPNYCLQVEACDGGLNAAEGPAKVKVKHFTEYAVSSTSHRPLVRFEDVLLFAFANRTGFDSVDESLRCLGFVPSAGRKGNQAYGLQCYINGVESYVSVDVRENPVDVHNPHNHAKLLEINTSVTPVFKMVDPVPKKQLSVKCPIPFMGMGLAGKP